MSEQKNWREMNAKEKFLGCSTLIVVAIIIILSFNWLTSRCSSEETHSEIVYNAGSDGNVKQVEKYLKDNLNDPNSYQPIEWSKVVKNGSMFKVRHKYRAKNGFGALMIYNQVFTVDSIGNVIFVYDYGK